MKLVPTPRIRSGAGVVLVDHRGPRAGGRPERQRVVLGERALAVQGRGDGDAGQLGQLDQLGGRPRVEHALAGQDHRVARGGQAPRGLGYVVGQRLREARPGRPHVPVGVAGIAVHHVVRHGDQGRTVAHAEHRVQGAAERLRPGGRAVDRRREAGDRPVRLLASEARARVLLLHRVLRRHEQDRAAVAVGLGDRPECGLGARPVLGDAGQEPLAVRGAGEAVGDVHRNALGAGDDRAHAERGGGVDEPVLGEPDNVLRSLALEQPGDPVSNQHGLVRHHTAYSFPPVRPPRRSSRRPAP